MGFIVTYKSIPIIRNYRKSQYCDGLPLVKKIRNTMDPTPIYTPFGAPGSCTYSKTVPVTTYAYEAMEPVILRAIGNYW